MYLYFNFEIHPRLLTAIKTTQTEIRSLLREKRQIDMFVSTNHKTAQIPILS